MQAFVEKFCEHAGVVRAGPDAIAFGAPYDFAVAYKVDGQRAIIKGLVANGSFTNAHARAIIAALRAIGLLAVWERANKKRPHLVRGRA